VIKPFNIDKLWFSPAPWAAWFGIIALVIVAVLCFIAIKRSSRKGRTSILEFLRFICAVAVVLMLWKPEWRESKPPKDEPKIAIIYDGTGSMKSKDALKAEIFGGKKGYITREEWVKLALDPKFWDDLKLDGKTEYFIEPFSAPSEKADATELAMTGSDYYQHIDQLLEKHDNLRAIIVLGDGDHNVGSPPSTVAVKALKQRVPIYTIPVGTERYLPDIELLQVDAPEYGIVGETVQIQFAVRSSLDRDLRTKVTLTDKNSGRKVDKQISIPKGAKNHQLSLLWKVDSEKAMSLELSIPVQPNEISKKNNMQRFVMEARKENIKVLVVETLPRWEYRFIRNALSRDPGVDLDCLLLHPTLGKGDGPDYIKTFPEKLEDLQKYDVIFLGDIGVGPDQLTVKQADLIKGLIENQASGLVFIPGSQGNIFSLLKKDKQTGKLVTELGDLIPVELDAKRKEGFSDYTPAPLQLTEKGKGSHLTMLGDNEQENGRIWQDLPGFNWYAPVEKAKVGTEILAVHSSKRTKTKQRMPMLVTSTAGSGKVLFLAHDSAWRWRKGVEDLYHYRFWGQVARWMSYKRNRAAGDSLRLFFNVERPKPGTTLTLRANAFDKNGAPIEDGAVYAEITDPNGNSETLTLEREGGEWGSYNGQYKVSLPGEYQVKTYTSVEPNKILETAFTAQGTEIEKIGYPSRFATLKEMANISKGEMISADEIDTLASKINELPEREPQVSRTAIWEQWPLMAALIAILAIFWTGRKMNGTF